MKTTTQEFLEEMENSFRSKKVCEDHKEDYKFIADKIKEVAENSKNAPYGLDLDTKTCLAATEIINRPFSIIKERAFNLPVLDGLFYMIPGHDLRFIITNLELILQMFANKMQHELEQNASNTQISTEDKSTEKL